SSQLYQEAVRNFELRKLSKYIISSKFKNKKQQPKYFFAIASKSGKIIDQHFGHADKFLIYTFYNNIVEFYEEREIEKYCSGKECFDKGSRMENIIAMLDDCTAIFCTRIGHKPKKTLKNKGIEVMEMYELIEDGIKYYTNDVIENKKTALLFK
ncbi:NifB/NifX family molybdenum-iron cluster-binding protein, partial [Natronospora cellulosivora (SeqCode)]